MIASGPLVAVWMLPAASLAVTRIGDVRGDRPGEGLHVAAQVGGNRRAESSAAIGRERDLVRRHRNVIVREPLHLEGGAAGNHFSAAGIEQGKNWRLLIVGRADAGVV